MQGWHAFRRGPHVAREDAGGQEEPSERKRAKPVVRIRVEQPGQESRVPALSERGPDQREQADQLYCVFEFQKWPRAK